MPLLVPQAIGPMGGPYQTLGAKFDGTNDYMSVGSLTGAADGKKGIVAASINWLGGDGGEMAVLWGDQVSTFKDINLYRSSGNKYVVKLYIAGTNTVTGQVTSSSSFTSSSGWHTLLLAWDLAAATFQMYVGNTDEATGVTANNNTVDHTAAEYAVGARATTHAFKCNADFADIYVNRGEYLDISNAANRAKIVDATTAKPVDKGSDGSLVTGTAPIQFHRILPGGSASDFATNSGTGGNFTVTGALDLSASNPTD